MLVHHPRTVKVRYPPSMNGEHYDRLYPELKPDAARRFLEAPVFPEYGA